MLTVLKLPVSLSSRNTQAPGVPLRRRASLSSLGSFIFLPRSAPRLSSLPLSDVCRRQRQRLFREWLQPPLGSSLCPPLPPLFVRRPTAIHILLKASPLATVTNTTGHCAVVWHRPAVASLPPRSISVFCWERWKWPCSSSVLSFEGCVLIFSHILSFGLAGSSIPPTTPIVVLELKSVEAYSCNSGMKWIKAVSRRGSFYELVYCYDSTWPSLSVTRSKETEDGSEITQQAQVRCLHTSSGPLLDHWSAVVDVKCNI